VLVLYVVGFITASLVGLGTPDLIGTIASTFAQMTLVFMVVLALGLLWYMPYMAAVGAMGSVVGRWAIPLTLLLPSILSALEWVTLGGAHPFDTATSRYLTYRSQMPISTDYLDRLFEGQVAFDSGLFVTDLLQKFDWLQVGIGITFGLGMIYLASEYRRRSSAN